MQGTASLTQPTNHPSSLIHPQEDPVTIAENQVVALLDELENIGALQRSNRMELEEILNPPGEDGIEEATDEDIFNAVMEARREEEGRYDGDDTDTGTLVEPTPTRKPTRAEALQAALTIIRYIKDEEGAYFRELESALALFVSELEKMADTEP